MILDLKLIRFLNQDSIFKLKTNLILICYKCLKMYTCRLFLLPIIGFDNTMLLLAINVFRTEDRKEIRGLMTELKFESRDDF